ncbi:kinase-like domain-containing protein [Rhizophagus clarus]|uniref:Kinase-like domain-containing protein n=1 Tax=Rhizophagus clarus TaxID=94130 RepID=A0A8H3M6R6_9GLOM|nr:kinase-like domain-containing protein [Rhizophagus clarus]
MVLRYIYGGSLSLEEYDTLDIIKILVASNELKYLGKVYPYKKIIPKDMRENLFRHFMDQSNSNPEPIITKEVDSITISSTQKNEKDFNMIVDGINDLIYESLNKGIDRILIKQKVIEYFNDHNIDAQETYNWLLNNQISINSIFLLGYFNYYGIETSLNYEKAFNLFISASEKDHTLAQFFLGDCYKIGRGTIKNEKLTFEYYEKAANKNLSQGQTSIGYCYKNGACVKKDLIKAFYWYEKAAKNGNITAISNLGHCYDNGIGITVDKQKAFELYQNAANLGKKVAQYNLALMYEKGDGIIKDIDKAIYWYEKSAKQGDKDAQNKLKILQKNQ